MTYIYIIVGIWTFLAICWTFAFLVGDAEGGKATKLERLVQSVERVSEDYHQNSNMR